MRYFISVVSLLLAFTTASAQGFHWEPTSGPATDAVWMMMVNSNGDIIAGSLSAIVRSSDHGQHWLPFPNSNIVGEVPLYVALPDSKLIISSGNSKTSFIRIDADGYNRKTLSVESSSDLVVDHSGNLYSVGGSTISRSSNEGDSWQTMPGPASETMNCFAVDAAHYYVGTNTGVYFSSDSGATWKRSLSGLPNATYYSIQTGSNGRVWATTYSDEGTTTFLSNDFGQMWSKIPTSGYQSALFLAVRKDNSALLYGAGECSGELDYLVGSNLTSVGQFLQSSDGSTGGYNVASVDSNGNWVATGGEACNGPDDMSGASSNIYYSTSDSAAAWQPIPAPLSSVSALFPVYNTVLGLQALGSFIMDDSGNWQHTSAYSVRISETDPYDNSLLGSTSSGGVQRSTDSGRSWANIFPSAPSGLMYVAATSANTIYAGSNGLYVTTNSGTVWNETNDATLGTISGLIADNNGTLYAGASNGLFVSTGSGSSWSNISPSGAASINFLRRNANGALALESSGKVFRSNDQGSTWQSVSMQSGTGLVLNNNGDVFASSSSGVYYWPNGSSKTFNVSDSLQGRGVIAIAMSSDQTLYAAIPGLGVWKGIGDLSVLGVAKSLSANNLIVSPNPASTSVSISLPSLDKWAAIAYDALGRICPMSYILNGKTLKCDVSSFGPGAYEIVLHSEKNEIESRIDIIR